MSPATPLIALCICTFNRYDLLPKAIESASKQSLGRERYCILVIDNSPDHERAEAFGRLFGVIPHLEYVVERTPGLSNARNVAARRNAAPIIAFMDDDAIASPTWAEEILRAFDRFGPSAMVVGGRVDPIWSEPRPAWLHDALLGNLSIVDWGGDTRVAAEGEWFAGANIAFRVSAIVAHGGFSTRLGRMGSGSSLLSNEEIHLLERIRRAGGQAIYAPKAKVDHLVEAKRLTRSWFRKRNAWQALSDFTMRSEANVAQAKETWAALVAYFNALPPLERTVRGLLSETDDPEMFLWQMGAIYNLTSMLLTGFEEVKID